VHEMPHLAKCEVLRVTSTTDWRRQPRQYDRQMFGLAFVTWIDIPASSAAQK